MGWVNTTATIENTASHPKKVVAINLVLSDFQKFGTQCVPNWESELQFNDSSVLKIQILTEQSASIQLRLALCL